MTKVKVCGMTSIADAEQAADLGAWAIGLIHHPESPGAEVRRLLGVGDARHPTNLDLGHPYKGRRSAKSR